METIEPILKRTEPTRIWGYFPLLLVCVIFSNLAKGATATVGGYTYTYETRTYGALIQNRPYSDYDVAITPNPTGALTIPSTLGSRKVYAIGQYAFKNCSFTSVTVPEGVEQISEYAFYYCRSMSAITIPLSIVSIYGSGNAFYVCPSLRTLNTPAHYNVATVFSYQKESITTVNITSGSTSIREGAFSGFTSLKNLTIPTSVKTIGASAFKGCSSLETVVIPKGVETIGASSFDGCSALETVVISEGVKAIESAAFRNCTKLKSVTIPSSVTNIASSAFSGCTALTSVIVPNSVLKLGTGVFKGCSKLKEVVLPIELTNLPSQIFQDCTMLQTVAIPSFVTKIGDFAFSGCASFSSVSLPAATKSIGAYAFNNCTSLETCNYPSGLEIIGESAFLGCERLTSVEFPPSISTLGSFAYASCTNLQSVIMSESNVAEIPQSAFEHCISLRYLKLPKSLVSVGVSAFSSCNKLKNLALPSTLTSIGNDAFKGCSSLQSTMISSAATSVGTGAYAECSSLLSISIPSQVIDLKSVFPQTYASISNVIIATGETTVKANMFDGCTSLKIVVIPESVTRICDGAFTECSSLLGVYYYGDAPDVGLDIYVGTPKRMTSYVVSGSIGWSGALEPSLPETWCDRMIALFDGTSPIVEEDPDRVDQRTVNGVVFNIFPDYTATVVGSCSLSGVVTIPDMIDDCKVTMIASRAFAENNKITSVQFPQWCEEIADSAFERCLALETVLLPANLRRIGNSAFRECVLLASVNIPQSVETIGCFAFRDCRTLTHYTVPPTTRCMMGAFENVSHERSYNNTQEGFVVVVSEIVGDALLIPSGWANAFPGFNGAFGSDFAKAATKRTGKRDAAGKQLMVWHDYVAGTDPTDVNDVFKATLTIENGIPKISYSPILNAEETAKRKYTFWGKRRLAEDAWIEIEQGQETEYNFFKVTVEMR